MTSAAVEIVLLVNRLSGALQTSMSHDHRKDAAFDGIASARIVDSLEKRQAALAVVLPIERAKHEGNGGQIVSRLARSTRYSIC